MMCTKLATENSIEKEKEIKKEKKRETIDDKIE